MPSSTDCGSTAGRSVPVDGSAASGRYQDQTRSAGGCTPATAVGSQAAGQSSGAAIRSSSDSADPAAGLVSAAGTPLSGSMIRASTGTGAGGEQRHRPLRGQVRGAFPAARPQPDPGVVHRQHGRGGRDREGHLLLRIPGEHGALRQHRRVSAGLPGAQPEHGAGGPGRLRIVQAEQPEHGEHQRVRHLVQPVQPLLQQVGEQFQQRDPRVHRGVQRPGAAGFGRYPAPDRLDHLLPVEVVEDQRLQRHGSPPVSPR